MLNQTTVLAMSLDLGLILAAQLELQKQVVRNKYSQSIQYKVPKMFCTFLGSRHFFFLHQIEAL